MNAFNLNISIKYINLLFKYNKFKALMVQYNYKGFKMI